MPKSLTPTALLLALAGLAGCVTLPEVRAPSLDLPEAWAPATPAAPTGAVQERWWQAYGDATLNRLIEEALAHSPDIRLAAARIEEARAKVSTARADQLPEVSLGAAAERARSSEEGSFAPPSPVNNTFSVDLQTAFEIDLWGRYREARKAARAELLASRYAQEVVRVSLASQVARGYFTLRALDASLAVLDDTRANRVEGLALLQRREAAGLGSALVVHQAEAELAALDASRATLLQTRQQQELALAVLLGRAPRALMDTGAEARDGAGLDALLISPPPVPAGLPSELLQRRPDLRQAEQTLRASQARLLETSAALYPSLSLTANLGSESTSLSDLFSGPAMIWGFGAGMTQTLFNGGRTESALKAADARQQQALITYEETVRQAFREVLDALIAHRQARERAEAELRRAAALRQALELARLRHDNGLANYLEVLDAQRGLLQAEQNRLDALRDQLLASAQLIKALGGGWQDLPAETAENDPPAGKT